MAKSSRGKGRRAIAYRTESAIRRREFRHSHDGPEALPHVSHKDTKRWCRGKVGREHVNALVRHFGIANDFMVETCQRCGRRGRWFICRRKPGQRFFG